MATDEKTQVSVRVPTAMIGEFERIAVVLDRDRTWVMLRAFRTYLDGEGAQLLEEAAGLEQLDAGEGVAFDTVLDEADAIIAGARSRRRANAG
jgi:predicted transcriptional regulator